MFAMDAKVNKLAKSLEKVKKKVDGLGTNTENLKACHVLVLSPHGQVRSRQCVWGGVQIYLEYKAGIIHNYANGNALSKCCPGIDKEHDVLTEVFFFTELCDVVLEMKMRFSRVLTNLLITMSKHVMPLFLIHCTGTVAKVVGYF